MSCVLGWFPRCTEAATLCSPPKLQPSSGFTYQITNLITLRVNLQVGPQNEHIIRYRVSRCLSLHCKLSVVQCVFLEPLGYSASCAKFTGPSGFVSLINWDLQVWNFEGRMMMNHSSLPDFVKTNPKKSHPLLTAPDHRKLPPFVEGLIWWGFNRFCGSAQPQETGI